MEGDWNLVFAVITACHETVSSTYFVAHRGRQRRVYTFSSQTCFSLCVALWHLCNGLVAAENMIRAECGNSGPKSLSKVCRFSHAFCFVADLCDYLDRACQLSAPCCLSSASSFGSDAQPVLNYRGSPICSCIAFISLTSSDSSGMECLARESAPLAWSLRHCWPCVARLPPCFRLCGFVSP